MVNTIPVLQLVGYKRSGKTTLLTRLVHYFTHQRGFTIFTIKHHNGPFQFDRERSDSLAHRQAGAKATLLQSPTGLALSMAHNGEQPLEELINWVSALEPFDLILVEGYKFEPYPKLVLIRHMDQLALLNQLSGVRGVVFHSRADHQAYVEGNLGPYPAFLFDQPTPLFHWIEKWVRQA